MHVCVCAYGPWRAILLGRVEVLLHALVVLELSGDRDGQRLTMVALVTATVASSWELGGPANNSEKNTACRGTRTTEDAVSVWTRRTSHFVQEHQMFYTTQTFSSQQF